MPRNIENLDTIWQNPALELNQLIGKIIKTTDSKRDGWFECYIVVALKLVNYNGKNNRAWHYVLTNLRDKDESLMYAYELLDAVRGRQNPRTLQTTGNIKYQIIPEHEHKSKNRTLYWMAELTNE